EHHSEIVNPRFGVNERGEIDKRLMVESLMRADLEFPPIQFDRVTLTIVVQYLESKVKPNGVRVGYNRLGGIHSAILHLFRTYRNQIDPQLHDAMVTYLKNKRRTIARTEGNI